MTPSPIQPDIDEALRYLGIHAPDPEARQAMEAAAARLTGLLSPRWVFRDATLIPRSDGFLLAEPGILLPGRTASTMLQTCQRAALLVCTLGAGFDALLREQQARSMTQAVMLDACGSAYVEAGCSAAEKAIAEAHPGLYLTDRFSPGYGDLPLTLQPGLLAYLDAPRRLGVTALDSCLMAPAKTVTALIGLSQTPQRARIRGCAFCSMRNTCTLRKRGGSCEP